MKKFTFRQLVLGCTCLLASQVSLASTANERPNILVILTDDMGYADVGFNGSPDIRTPNLDQLAAEGTMMTSAYNAHPFCGPSRAGIMTGRYPHKFGSQFNLPTSDRSGGLGIPTSEIFISEVLQDAGYHTGAIGKWHLGEDGDFHPNNRGFDDFYGFLNGGHDYFPSKFKAQYEKQRKQGLNHSIFHYLRPLEHNGKEVDVNEYLTDALSGQAVNFIEASAKDKKQPFFLYLAYNAPHSPMQAKEEDMAQFPEIKDKKRKIYAGMVYAVDRGVKEIVQTLKDTGQYDNTLIVFFSDNGGKPNLGANNYPLKGRKGSVLEGGYRTPMFFHWPKKIPNGKTFTFPISTLDLYPTFAKIAGAEIPKKKKLDGKNLIPSLVAGTDPRPGEMIYAVRHRNGYSEAAARKDNWKIVNVSGKWQLFDVEKDSSESNDLSKEYPLVVREMVAEMEMWSWSNTQPSWFHNHAEGALWREKAMPRFHETFSLKEKAANELNVH
ncbi:sulfatase-like hydrolase/transferase [Colwellia sp. 1_MG-2023]|uniref:sulfatase-like hydrolase/transferase n=1 Tax=unclassified Colwellia TaxID=196834 RepID=UPI001C09B7B0|nr:MULTISPECIES: sulfatase-like hydrolase/transferase [unclassified Colwellia]MBU2924265.1 sulfatase-like hydrolase/transferase [Colwellia sp. C2M11]MDO6652974.1 sulfatase-like hydrolase/transferase [Colwellia sp. 3_MG-2023]MDO6665456.1 sulfatase-like hydrolase/transferase [Colwellia sp. 2_MG-2023]MDO6689785.1 sulfatase-like hydrolase/transferase [Colwellia sp. 1_MG-2023]